MSSAGDERLAALVILHLAEIGAGRCSLDDAAITREPDPVAREILMGLLVLHEDLLLEREQRRQASEEREILLRERTQAVQARDEFLSVGAHELRTPLTSLRLQVELTSRTTEKLPPDLPVRSELTGRLESLRRQLARLELLVSQLLDVSRLNAGRLELHPEDLDVADVAREVLERFQPELERRDVPLALTGKREVPARVDRLRLEEVLTNLVSNALRYGRDQPVEVQLDADDAEVTIAVRDRGLGIGPEDQTRLFQPFAQLDSTRHSGGMGLGLWIVRNMVEAMGGRIALTSEVSVGSTFAVTLPRRHQMVPTGTVTKDPPR